MKTKNEILSMNKRELKNYSIHYAEDCAENYVNKIFNTNKQFLTE